MKTLGIELLICALANTSGNSMQLKVKNNSFQDETPPSPAKALGSGRMPLTVWHTGREEGKG